MGTSDLPNIYAHTHVNIYTYVTRPGKTGLIYM